MVIEKTTCLEGCPTNEYTIRRDVNGVASVCSIDRGQTPKDMRPVPPVPCDFTPGDRAIYTNDYGVEWEVTVRGFSGEDQSLFKYGKFVYLDWSCWWFPVDPKQLRHAQPTRAHPTGSAQASIRKGEAA